MYKQMAESSREYKMEAIAEADACANKYCRYKNRYEYRERNNGNGDIKKVEFSSPRRGCSYGMVKLTSGGNGSVYKYENGRWWNGGFISRNRVEDELRLWPGYLDGVESMLDAMEEKTEEIEQGWLKLADEKRELEWKYNTQRRSLWDSWSVKNPSSGENMPECLSGVGGAERLEVVERGYVYFLIDKDKVVYVGQTKCTWPQRIDNHLREGQKVFDDVWYVGVPIKELDNVEKKYIKKFKPKYNVTNNICGGDIN